MNILSPLLYHLFIMPVSRLPFSVLYKLSDALSFLLFRVIRYRRKVIESNIRGSFPELSKAEQDQVIRDFCSHFTDLVLESFKLFSISEQELRSRIRFVNPELLDHYARQGKSVIVAGGHYNNWEYFAVAVQLNILHRAVALYKPLANKWFDVKMRENRGRYGMQMVAIQETRQFFESPEAQPTATIFGMDQSPSKVKRSHWMKFLGRDTAVIFGTEKYSRDFNQPVIFGRILKERRGFYRVEFELITDKPEEMPHGKIVERAMELLENDIRKAPAWWLWTHRRWKHRRPVSAE